MTRPTAPALGLVLGLAGACAGPTTTAPTTTAPTTAAPTDNTRAAFDPAAVVAASDRSDADRALDPGRHPAETLAFFDVRPGMRVAEIAAGTGYTSELLARAVGAAGRVYAVNSPWVLARFAQAPWTARLDKPVMAPVVRLDREFDAPFPPDVEGLDLVCNVLFYHDTVWMKSDRAAMNTAVFDALRPGGHYVVIDHSAAEGRGTEDAKSLHRIEAATVRAEIEAAGFQLVEEGGFLRNPGDARDWNAAPSAAGDRRGQSDRFALKFVKP